MEGSDLDAEAAAGGALEVSPSDFQVDLENGWLISDLKVSGSSKSSHLSIKIPIEPAPCYADSCIGKGILHCHSLRFMINSSMFDGGCGSRGRRSFCLSSHSEAPPDSPTKNRQTSAAARQCNSLPATPTAAPSRPSVSAHRPPTRKEQQQFVIDPSKESDPMVPNIVIESSHDRSFSDAADDDAGTCRICLDTMKEGIKLKMACSCKGDLRLVHEACAVSWFSTKGNKVCEICDREVTNLPPIVFRVDSLVKTEEEGEDPGSQSWAMSEKSSVQEFLCLVLMSAIGYLFILELLLVQEKTSRGLAIAAPFAFGLGILASIFAVILGEKEQIWRYATLEFAFVSVTIHIAYIMLSAEPVYSIMLGSVIGMVFAMSTSSLIRHCNSSPEPQ